MAFIASYRFVYFVSISLKQTSDEIEVLKILTYVGLALSLLGAVITVICYLLLTYVMNIMEGARGGGGWRVVWGFPKLLLLR